MAPRPDWRRCRASWSGAAPTPLAPGLIFSIAREAGLRVPEQGAKRAIRCPFHEDRHPSAFLSERNIFFCSVCTPEGGWTAKRFAEALRVSWSPKAKHVSAGTAFSARDAEIAWQLARQRALDDEQVDTDRALYKYLDSRGLMEAWELRLLGVLGRGMSLPDVIGWWPDAGYRLLVPVHDQHGRVANVQARSTARREPKVLFPKGSTARQTVFANTRGLALLRREDQCNGAVLFGEGLTDFLALSIIACLPVLAVPGTGVAASAIGPWVHGSNLYLALDNDSAGQGAIKDVAASAYRNGAARVATITWPAAAKDACEALESLGAVALSGFIEECVSRG